MRPVAGSNFFVPDPSSLRAAASSLNAGIVDREKVGAPNGGSRR
jgi:hypothetical protein